MKLQDEKNIRVKEIFYGMALNLIRRNRNVLKILKNNRSSKRKNHQNLWINHNLSVVGLLSEALFVTLDGRLEGVRKDDDCYFVDKIVVGTCSGLKEGLVEGVDGGSIEGVVVSTWLWLKEGLSVGVDNGIFYGVLVVIWLGLDEGLQYTDLI